MSPTSNNFPHFVAENNYTMVHWILPHLIHTVKGHRCLVSFSLECFIVNTFLLLEVSLCYEVWNPPAPCCFTGKSTERALCEYQVSKHTWHTLNAGPKLNKSSTISHTVTHSHSQQLWKKSTIFKGRKNHSFGPSVLQRCRRQDSKTLEGNKNVLKPKWMQMLIENSWS